MRLQRRVGTEYGKTGRKATNSLPFDGRRSIKDGGDGAREVGAGGFRFQRLREGKTGRVDGGNDVEGGAEGVFVGKTAGEKRYTDACTVGALGDAAGDLAHEGLAVGATFAGDDPVGGTEGIVEADGVEDEVDAGDEAGAEAGEDACADAASGTATGGGGGECPRRVRRGAIGREDLGDVAETGVEGLNGLRGGAFLGGEDVCGAGGTVEGSPDVAGGGEGESGEFGRRNDGGHAGEVGAGGTGGKIRARGIEEAEAERLEEAEADVVGGAAAEAEDDAAGIGGEGGAEEFSGAVGRGAEGIAERRGNEGKTAGGGDFDERGRAIAGKAEGGFHLLEEWIVDADGNTASVCGGDENIDQTLAAIGHGHATGGVAETESGGGRSAGLGRGEATFEGIEGEEDVHGGWG